MINKRMKNNFGKYIMSVALALGLMLPFQGQTQESNLGDWLIYIGSVKMNSKFNFHNEVQYRNYNFIGDLEQLLIRVGVGYELDENKNNFLLGYGYILSENYTGNGDEKVTVHENRIFQQLILKQNLGPVKINHRYRFEQRFVSSDFKMRFRYFLSLSLPFQKAAERTFYLSAYNEIFLNTKSNIFDRNRLYGGLGYKFSPKIRLELGYMNQFFETGGRDQINIISFVNF